MNDASDVERGTTDDQVHRIDRLLRRARTWTLFLCFWVWLLIGLGILLGEGAGDTARDAGAFHVLLPTPIRAAEWIIPAAMVLVTMITGRWARVAVPLLVVGPLIRITSYSWAWLLQLIPGVPEGLESGWYFALLHVTFLGLVVVAALLTSEDRRAHR